jgi:hypothetical protein
LDGKLRIRIEDIGGFSIKEEIRRKQKETILKTTRRILGAKK